MISHAIGPNYPHTMRSSVTTLLSSFLALLSVDAFVRPFVQPGGVLLVQRRSPSSFSRSTSLRMGLLDDPVGWIKRGMEVMQDDREAEALHILKKVPYMEKV